jgi:uncharacterized membrane protein
MNNQTDNPENYRMGFIYFNKNDKRVIVPKQDRLRGYTFNFANPITYLLIIGIIVVILAASYLF